MEEMYSFCAHHLTSTVERQEEIRIGAASATNKWWRLLTTATGATEIDKAWGCDVYSVIDETRPADPQTPAEILDMASPVERFATPVKCGYLE